jgi:hypothetical protein
MFTAAGLAILILCFLCPHTHLIQHYLILFLLVFSLSYTKPHLSVTIVSIISTTAIAPLKCVVCIFFHPLHYRAIVFSYSLVPRVQRPIMWCILLSNDTCRILDSYIVLNEFDLVSFSASIYSCCLQNCDSYLGASAALAGMLAHGLVHNYACICRGQRAGNLHQYVHSTTVNKYLGQK